MNDKICAYCGKEAYAGDCNGLPACHECVSKLSDWREKKGIKPAGRRYCFEDGVELKKDVVQNVTIERCPKCGAVWLSKAELDNLRTASQSLGEASASQFWLGALFGRMI